MKIGRNRLCPCGSGKKYKKCCLERPQPGFDWRKVVGVSIDREENQVIYVTKDLLLNTLRRDANAVAQSFDQLHGRDLEEMSELLATACFLILTGHREMTRRKAELRATVCNLLWNAVNTFMGAATLLRSGFYPQAPILIRSIVETLAAVLHLGTVPGELQRFKDGKVDSKRVIRSAKEVLPPFGWIWGHLSDSFVHINPIHGQFQPIMPYDEKFAEPLRVNTLYLRFAVWLIYVVTEFTFYDITEGTKYWTEVERGKAKYNPSQETLEWQKMFLMGEALQPLRRQAKTWTRLI
jgi:hypothetical protein